MALRNNNDAVKSQLKPMIDFHQIVWDTLLGFRYYTPLLRYPCKEEVMPMSTSASQRAAASLLAYR